MTLTKFGTAYFFLQSKKLPTPRYTPRKKKKVQGNWKKKKSEGYPTAFTLLMMWIIAWTIDCGL